MLWGPELMGSSGILLIDKPSGLTSHDVVARVRRAAQTRKVGHAGTLDPMATGLLVIGVGSSTRLLTYIVGVDKTYEATIRLGESTSTDDAEGETTATASRETLETITDEAVHRATCRLSGKLNQVPSTFSAVKVDGQRAYSRARAGEQVTLAARPVTVSEFAVHDISRSESGDRIDVKARISCSSGTYVRALARDMGEMLGLGGHLTRLRRTRVGPFDVAQAVPLEGLDVARSLRSPSEVAGSMFPVVNLSETEATALGHGKTLSTPLEAAAIDDSEGPLAGVGPRGDLIGLVRCRNGTIKSIVNFPDSERG